MGITVQDAPGAQTVSGQPAESAPNNVDATPETPVVETPAATPETPTTETTPKVEGEPKPTAADVNISPDALRQITALSRKNRELTTKLAEVSGKLTATGDVAEKLKRLETLEAALENPKQWLALSKKTLEDVAAATVEDEVAHDPRVDALIAQQTEAQKEIERLRNERQGEQTQQHAARVAEQTKQSIAYVDGIIKATKLPDGSARWERVAKDPKAAEAVFNAASKVVERDYGERKNEKGEVIRAGKPLDKAAADKILMMVLDEAEAMELARELLEARQKGAGQTRTLSASSRGLEIREESPSMETPARKPSLTITGERGATRSVPVQRGQTDVRTARARAMKIAGVDDSK